MYRCRTIASNGILMYRKLETVKGREQKHFSKAHVWTNWAKGEKIVKKRDRYILPQVIGKTRQIIWSCANHLIFFFNNVRIVYELMLWPTVLISRSCYQMYAISGLYLLVIKRRNGTISRAGGTKIALYHPSPEFHELQ